MAEVARGCDGGGLRAGALVGDLWSRGPVGVAVGGVFVGGLLLLLSCCLVETRVDLGFFVPLAGRLLQLLLEDFVTEDG